MLGVQHVRRNHMSIIGSTLHGDVSRRQHIALNGLRHAVLVVGGDGHTGRLASVRPGVAHSHAHLSSHTGRYISISHNNSDHYDAKWEIMTVSTVVFILNVMRGPRCSGDPRLSQICPHNSTLWTFRSSDSIGRS
jgi:hypothetical protein